MVEILKGLDFELPRRSVTGIVGELVRGNRHSAARWSG